MSKKKIKKAIFPVGGLGTRFLPATKSIPKEMLPVLDKPLIQYAVEEALEAANNNDLKPMNSLLSILKKPYTKQNDIENFQLPSKNQNYQTFCGT